VYSLPLSYAAKTLLQTIHASVTLHHTFELLQHLGELFETLKD
jgi:hypothetical protein